MSDQFLAEIRIFAGNFAPTGWALCQGQLMAISQNTALFSLLGTNYGGDGKSTFALPNLQNCAPMSFGQGPGLTDRVLGETGGSPNVTVLQSEMPAHSHLFNAVSNPGTTTEAANSWLGIGQSGPPNQATKAFVYESASVNTQMNGLAIGPAGSSFPHNNLMPYLGLTFIIALQGIFPARN
jgi:microcystin-dependent protein